MGINLMGRNKYNKILTGFSERFYELRREPNQLTEDGKKKSFKQISEEIEDLYGVIISHTQLAKYHKISLDEDEEENFLYPNIKSLLAMADYYGVSLEYLLGLSNTKSYKAKFKKGSKVFGLSDEAMERLEKMIRHPMIPFPPEYNFNEADFINFLIVNFARKLQNGVIPYFKALDEVELYDDKSSDATFDEELELKDKAMGKKYAITQILDKFLDELRQEISYRGTL